MRVPPSQLAEIIAHAQREAPNECCGMLGGADGRASTIYPAVNEFASPTRFQIESQDQLRIVNEIEARDEELAALYHSHPKSEAYPSETDVNLAGWWPGVTWLICSLAGREPIVRAFEIRDGAVEEVELVVDPA